MRVDKVGPYYVGFHFQNIEKRFLDSGKCHKILKFIEEQKKKKFHYVF